ncbi:MAG: tetratricopeptide repeat protein [Planctomycetota bacterium]|jgi:tetratricopeptide (TPR) repeat protein
MRALPFLLLASVLFAQDDLLPPDEVADLVDRYVDRGIESFREGSYDEAEARFKKALKRDPKSLRAQIGLVKCRMALGSYSKARDLLEKINRASAEARLLEAALDLREGRYEQLKPLLQPLLEQPKLDEHGLHAGYLLAEAYGRTGKRDDAKDILNRIVDRYKERYDVLADAAFNADELRHEIDKARPLSREMTTIASSLRLYVELFPLEYDFIENAMELIGYARKLDNDNWDAWTEYVRITRNERNRAIARARKARDVVTKRNPELADLWVEVARSLAVGWNQGEQLESCMNALQVNPRQTDAHAIVARIHLEDNRYAKANEHIQKALDTNPRHREALALRATLRLLQGDKKGFETGMKDALTVDARYGEGFHLAGLVVAGRQRRFEDALALVRRGLAIDPANYEAHTSVGIFLANLGRADEALIALRKSRELLPYDHPIRENFEEILKYVATQMVEQKTEHFVIRYDPAEYEVHHRYLPEVLEESWADMVKRYGFEPKKPVLVECFRTQDDFSVRTLGIPGIPALGACWGGLITLDSPTAFGRPFNWHSTAVHEFGHVITLQLSGGQVPRWFTEGVSVLEEKPFSPGWGREEQFERQLLDAYLTDTLPKIAYFDGMFRSNRIAYAYYVAGLMMQMIRREWGEEGINKALKLWAKDTPQGEVFQKAFDISMDEFDTKFRAEVKKRVDSYRLVPNYSLIYLNLMREREKEPKDGMVDVKLGWAHLRRNEIVDAGSYLDSAQRKGAGEKPLAILLAANLRWRSRDFAGTEALLKKYFNKGGEDFDARMMMVSILAQRNERDSDAVIAHLKQAKKNWPLRAAGTSPYSLLQRIYMRRDMAAEALREIEERAAILDKDVDARLQLAREYARLGRTEDQIRILEEAKRINNFMRPLHDALVPLYRETKQLKKAVRSARCRVALRTEEDADEDVARMWLDLADVLLDAGQVREARAALDEAKKLTDVEALPRIAEVEKRIGA